jgi:hypothetical protein
VDAPRRQAPVDAPVLGAPAAEIAPVAQDLGRKRGGAVQERGQRSLEDEAGGLYHAPEDLGRGVVVVDRHGLPVDDAPGVGLHDHLVQGGAGFALAVDDGPVDRHAAPVLRQERAVQVEGAAAGHRQHRERQHLPVVEREEEVERDFPEPRGEGGLVGVPGGCDLQSRLAREALHAGEPDVLARAVAVGHHERHAYPVREQHGKAAAAHVVVGEDDRSGAHPARTSRCSRTAWTR